MIPTAPPAPTRTTARELVRRILLASAVIAGASCADHKPATRPQPIEGYEPYAASAPPTDPPVADAATDVTAPSEGGPLTDGTRR